MKVIGLQPSIITPVLYDGIERQILKMDHRVWMKKLLLFRILTKTYRVPKRDPGIKAALNQFISPKFQDVVAVNHVSFEIKTGEIVALIGPNGAGKTTTLKVLTGLLQPTDGSILVAGYTPGKRQHAFLKVISMVLGNKSQMLWDIPALDTFQVLGEIYQIEKNEVKRQNRRIVFDAGDGRNS